MKILNNDDVYDLYLIINEIINENVIENIFNWDDLYIFLDKIEYLDN